MRLWMLVCLLVACERAGDRQNAPGESGDPSTNAPAGSQAIVDASIATLPNDAVAAPVIVDAPSIARTPPDARPARDDAKAWAGSLAVVSRDAGDLSSTRMPGMDLGRQIDDVRNGGNTVSIGGGTGRGGGAARGGVGGGAVGSAGSTKIDSSDSTSGPAGRISVASKRADDDTSLTIEMVLVKVQSAYMAGIKRCYKTQLKKDPTARGRMTIRFRVTETGATTSTRVTGFSKDVDTCVVERSSTWRFPAPKDSGAATTADFEITLQLVPD